MAKTRLRTHTRLSRAYLALARLFCLHIHCMMYGVVLTNHNILNRLSNVHLVIIVLEETNRKGNVVYGKYCAQTHVHDCM